MKSRLVHGSEGTLWHVIVNYVGHSALTHTVLFSVWICSETWIFFTEAALKKMILKKQDTG